MAYNSFSRHGRPKLSSRPRPNAGRRYGSSRPARARRNPGENIHPSRFVKSAKPIAEAIVFEPQHQFADFDISNILKNNLKAKGIDVPSPIQDEAIPVGLSGNDVIGIASTGTGKTIAFAIPVLNKLIANRNSKALIIAPTRELAQQIEEECRSIAKGSGLQGALLIGGSSMGTQLRDLRQRPALVIGTPGRIKDHMDRRTLNLSDFDHVVLDEVDRMLDMGFVNDMRTILGQLSPKRQSFFFSATMDSRVTALAQTFLNNPVTVSTKVTETSDYVEQSIVKYQSMDEKLEKLHELLIDTKIEKALVFDNTQRGVERLGKELQGRGFKVDAIHGGKSQGQRQRALGRFKENHVNILVATDVAARGIDVVDITHVVNYSIPQTYDDYVHRIGRAGRAGRAGFAMTFIENRGY